MNKILITLILFVSIQNIKAQDTITLIYNNDTIKVCNNKIINTKQTTENDTTLTVNHKKSDKIDVPDVKSAFSFNKILWAIVFLLTGYLVIQFISKSIEIWSEKKASRRVKGKAMLPIVKVIGWTMIFYIIIAVIFKPTSQSIFAFAASAGVAIGFAAQDILKNIFAGFIILVDKPFKVGDKIEVENIYGEVLDMSLRSTRILTKDDSVVSLPNGNLMNASISNSNSGELNCQVVAEIYLPITVDVDKVRKIAFEAAKISKYVYLAKPIYVLFVNVVDKGRIMYKMRLKAYVFDTRYEFAFKSEMTENVIKELINQNILNNENTNS